MNDQLLAAGLGPSTPGRFSNRPTTEFGHVNFSRHDGVGSVQISSPLTTEAAVKLEAFLRELIAEDGPRVRSIAEAQERQMEAAKRAEYDRMRRASEVNVGWAAELGN